MKKILLISTAILLFTLPVLAQEKSDLTVTTEDFYIVPGNENGPDKNGTGYHLFVRKKSGMECVMLIESNKDPAGKQTNYAYRATEYNKINGDEIRLLNGKVLDSETSRYSLIDSTAESNEKFGQCFHIYIPETIVFGYSWSRNGTVNIADGLFMNIRAFSKKYADYTGLFMDNSFNISKKKTVSKKTKIQSVGKTEKEVEEPDDEAEKTDMAARQYALNDTSAGNFAEKLEAYNSSYVKEDEEDLEQMASVPFEEEEETEADEDAGEEQYEVQDEEKPADKEIPSLIPFEEEELPVEEELEEEAEPEIEEIPEDERDVLSEIPFDESDAIFDMNKMEKARRSYDNWIEKALVSDPENPFNESMEGVDPDFVVKLEQIEAAKKALSEKKNEPEASEKVELGNRFITHNIEMVKLEGKKNIPDLYVSKTEVTQLAYASVMGENPSANQGSYLPVETVSWYDVIVFCNLLSIRDGLVPCYSINEARNPGAWGDIPRDNKKSWKNIKCDFDANGYRMLTIEEWEYFAAGGASKQNGKFAGNNYIEDVAWFKDNSEETTHIVGMKLPNACGLYDMCGNVSEWCWGDTGNAERPAAVRGGNYTYEKKYCRSDFKDACQAWYAHFENGIRICRSIE